MLKALAGLLILGVILVFWIGRGVFRTGRAVYDATVGSSDSYVATVQEASRQLGIDPRAMSADPRFLQLVTGARDTMSPHEFALHNALGIYLKEQIRDPKPYPNDLHLAIATGASWREAGLVRPFLIKEAISKVEDRLKASGLEL